MSVSTSTRALCLAAGLALAAAGSAQAFPKPKYATSLDDQQPASSAPASSTPKSSAPKSSAPKVKASGKAATVASSELPAAAANPANRPAPEKVVAAKPVATKVAAAEPAATRTAEGSKGWSIYVVQKGDTLSGVSRRFGAPVKTLADLNEVDLKTGLRPGAKLKLPPGTQDSGKDPYAGGPSPFALASESATHAPAARHVKPQPVKVAEAAPPPAQTAVAAPRPAPAPARPVSPPVSTPPQKEAEAEPAPVRLSMAIKTPAAEAAPAVASPLAEAAPEDPAALSGHGRFVWPVKGQVLTRFGPLAPGERNDGVNIAADQGADVRAAAAGEVVYAGSDVKGFGNVVLIKHPDGWVTAYAHLGGIGVRIRDHVAQGQSIGTVGRSGGVDQPQLHFETRYSAAPREKHRPVDPLTLLPQG